MKKKLSILLILILFTTSCNRYDNKSNKDNSKPTNPTEETAVTENKKNKEDKNIMENTSVLTYNETEHNVTIGDLNIKFNIPENYRILTDEEILSSLKSGKNKFGEGTTETNKELYLKMTSMFIDDNTKDSIQLVLDNSDKDITLDKLTDVIIESFSNVTAEQLSVANVNIQDIPGKTINYKVDLDNITLYYSYILLVKDKNAFIVTFTSENEINIDNYLNNFVN